MKCPRCGNDITPGKEFQSQKTSAWLCETCYKEECIALTKDALHPNSVHVDVYIPKDMDREIMSICAIRFLGFESENEFILESIRKNIVAYRNKLSSEL